MRTKTVNHSHHPNNKNKNSNDFFQSVRCLSVVLTVVFVLLVVVWCLVVCCLLLGFWLFAYYLFDCVDGGAVWAVWLLVFFVIL